MSWFEALTLAVIQGLTEFLPVSSSGHLAVADAAFEALRGAPTGGGLFFAVMLHVGTLAAIVAFYRRTAWAGARALLSGGGEPAAPSRSLVIHSVLLAAVATLPAVVVGLGFKEQVEAAFKDPLVPSFGFLVTGAVLLLTGRLPGGTKGPAETSWREALLVGLAQAMAITPGISRSGSTIVAALALGFSRTWAVGFSLLMAVPAILGAAVLEVRGIDPSNLTPDAIRMTVAATVLAFAIGYGAIIWLVRIVRAGRLWYFSVYVIALAGVLFSLIALSGGGRRASSASGIQSQSVEATDGQGRRSEALDRSGRGGLARSGAGGLGAGLVDRPDAPGPRPPGPPAGDVEDWGGG